MTLCRNLLSLSSEQGNLDRQEFWNMKLVVFNYKLESKMGKPFAVWSCVYLASSGHWATTTRSEKSRTRKGKFFFFFPSFKILDVLRKSGASAVRTLRVKLLFGVEILRILCPRGVLYHERDAVETSAALSKLSSRAFQLLGMAMSPAQRWCVCPLR